jgi:hypothetical protein
MGSPPTLIEIEFLTNHSIESLSQILQNLQIHKEKFLAILEEKGECLFFSKNFLYYLSHYLHPNFHILSSFTIFTSNYRVQVNICLHFCSLSLPTHTPTPNGPWANRYSLYEIRTCLTLFHFGNISSFSQLDIYCSFNFQFQFFMNINLIFETLEKKEKKDRKGKRSMERRAQNRLSFLHSTKYDSKSCFFFLLWIEYSYFDNNTYFFDFDLILYF